MLFKGLSAPPTQIITLVMGFLVICVGITVLQLSKIDPTTLEDGKVPGLDRRSTMLLKAARSNTRGIDEKDPGAMEDPGMDTLRGSFGAMGSIIRARSARRMSMSSAGRAGVGSGSGAGGLRSRHGISAQSEYNQYGEQPHYNGMGGHTMSPTGADGDGDRFAGMTRHQLYDPPVQVLSPPLADRASLASSQGQLVQSPGQLGSPRKLPVIKFGDEDIVHSYPAAGTEGDARHEHRTVSAFKPRGAADGTYLPVRICVSLIRLRCSLASGSKLANQIASTLQLGLEFDSHDPPPQSAPPTLFEDPYRSRAFPVADDPFANSPSTTILSDFPKRPGYARSTSSSSTTGATVGFGIRDSRFATDESGALHDSSLPAVTSSQQQQQQQHPHLDRLFGRSRSHSGSSHTPGRHYPRGDSRDDREESESLVNPHPSGADERDQSSTDSDSEVLVELPPQGSIRFVPPQPGGTLSSIGSGRGAGPR